MFVATNMARRVRFAEHAWRLARERKSPLGKKKEMRALKRKKNLRKEMQIMLLAFVGVGFMGMSKKDLNRHKASLKARLDELEKKARYDPLKKDRALWDEIELIKKKMAE